MQIIPDILKYLRQILLKRDSRESHQEIKMREMGTQPRGLHCQ